jgi:hypothetical protein
MGPNTLSVPRYFTEYAGTKLQQLVVGSLFVNFWYAGMYIAHSCQWVLGTSVQRQHISEWQPHECVAMQLRLGLEEAKSLFMIISALIGSLYLHGLYGDS